MIKVYLPVNKRRKSRIRGLWKGSQGLCYDYLIKQGIPSCDNEVLSVYLEYFKKQYNQEAIFYANNKRAYCWYNQSKVDIFKFCKYFHYKGSRGLKNYLKDLLQRFGGLTVYIREGQDYLIEIWS